MNASALALIASTVVILALMVGVIIGTVTFEDAREPLLLWLVAVVGLAAPKPTLGGPSE